jgi:hypothetical protein
VTSVNLPKALVTSESYHIVIIHALAL